MTFKNLTFYKDWKIPKIKHGKPTKYGWTVYYPEHFHMEFGVDIGAGCHIFCHEGVSIREGVQIGGGTFIYTLDTISGKCGSVYIDRGAVIGTQCLIMPGIHIGRNAVIGAQSMVNRDIGDDEIWYGTPARRRDK